MNRLLLPSFRSYVPGVPSHASKPAWHVPISLPTAAGLQLDFTPLLLVDEIVIDSATYQFLQSEDRKYLAPMAEAVDALEAEGFLKHEDLGALTAGLSLQIDVQTDRELRNARDWVPAILATYNGWLGLQQAYKEALGNSYSVDMPVEFGTYVYLMKRDGRVTEREVTRLSALLQSRKKRLSTEETDTICEIVRPSLWYTHAILAMSEALEMPFFDRDFLQRLYSEKYAASMRMLNPAIAREQARKETVQQLFTVALPTLRPTRASQVVKLLKNRRIQELRQFVDRAVDTKQPITREWGERLLTAALDAHMSLGKIRRVTQWFGLALGVVPGANIPVALAGEAADQLASRRLMGEHRWLFSLVESARG